MIRGTALNGKQRGDVYVFIDLRPEHLLPVHRDGEVFPFRCCGCLQDWKPVKGELNRSTVEQVKKKVPAVEMDVNRCDFHGNPLHADHFAE